MNYKILKDGEEVNTIVASEAFCASYCEKNGYTYEMMPMPEPEPIPEPEEELSVWDELDAAYTEGVNAV